MSISKQLLKIADLLDTIHEKNAYGLFSKGDQIVCLNPIEPLIKGQKYRVVEFPSPGYVSVEDLDGKLIGQYKGERFCLDNYES